MNRRPPKTHFLTKSDGIQSVNKNKIYSLKHFFVMSYFLLFSVLFSLVWSGRGSVCWHLSGCLLLLTGHRQSNLIKPHSLMKQIRFLASNSSHEHYHLIEKTWILRGFNPGYKGKPCKKKNINKKHNHIKQTIKPLVLWIFIYRGCMEDKNVECQRGCDVWKSLFKRHILTTLLSDRMNKYRLNTWEYMNSLFHTQI